MSRASASKAASAVPFPHLLIRASAGTGKTYQLSNRYLGLLGQSTPPEQILASTFTRKAAGEILERVLMRLARAALDPEAGQALGQEIGQGRLANEDFQVILRQVARNLHRLRISTLDAFFAQLASSFGLELGFPPGWSIIEDQQDRTLRQDAIEQLLSANDQHEVARLMHLMTKGEATRSVTELLEETVNQLYAVFQQTTEAAWRNFPDAPLLTQEEIVAIAEQLAVAELPADKRFASARDSDLENVLAGDWEAFLSKGLAKKVLEGEEMYVRKPIPREVLNHYQRLLDHARGLYLRQLAHQTGATHDLLARFDRIYRDRKLAARFLRFEDVTQFLAESRLGESLGKVHFRLDGEIRHLLLDEFQDTSYWQWKVLEPFARQVTDRKSGPSRAGGVTSFFCVGDVKQAIYGWRGGRSEIFDAIEGRLAGLTPDSLTKSYRSSQVVIDTVNQVFQNLASHPNLRREANAVTDWMERFEAHSTVHAALPGHVTLETSRTRDDVTKADQALLAAADRVAELTREAPGREIGVLVRRNQSVARLIFELKQRGIPASEEGGNPLTDSAAVLAMLGLLQLIDHPGDRVARFHVAQSPLGESLGFTDWRDSRAANQLARQLRAQLSDEGYGPSLLGWTRPVLATCSRRDASRLQQLVQLAYDYDPRATLRTIDFIEFVESQRVADPIPADVRVMTVHQSKGLQFEIVVLADLEATLVGQASSFVVQQRDVTAPVERVCLYRNEQVQQLLPDDFQRMFAQAIDQKVLEALCVLYVALTRAERALHIVIAPASPTEKTLPKSAAGLLRATLAPDMPAEESTVLYSHGDPDWHRGDTAARKSKDALRGSSSGSSLRKKIEFMGTPVRSHRLQRAAPSQLEGGWQVPLRDTLRSPADASLVRGTIVHAWFEEITWLDEGPPESPRLLEVARKLKPASLDLQQLLAEFFAMLERPEIREKLHRAHYRSSSNEERFGVKVEQVEVFNERRFAVRRNNELLSGVIDRLVLMKSRGQVVAAEILDYKTDRVGDGKLGRSLAEAREYYRPQQEAYRDAVARIYNLPPERIQGELLFVSVG